MNNLIIKGRERKYRGKLNSFGDLPIEKQILFKNIKTKINEYFVCKTYVFGSFHHGYWDDESDYDILIFEKIEQNIIYEIKKQFNIKVDIFFGRNNYGYIEIP